MLGLKSLRALTMEKSKSPGLVVGMIWLIVLLQACHHLVLHSSLRTEVAVEDSCQAEATSPHCVEERLFRSWQRLSAARAAEEDEERGASLRLEAKGDARSNRSVRSSQEEATQLTAMASTTAAAVAEALSTSRDAVPAAEATGGRRSGLLTDWARGLASLQQKMESRMRRLPSWKRRHPEEAAMARSNQGGANSTALDSMAAWLRDLQGLQEHLDALQVSLDERRSRLEANASGRAQADEQQRSEAAPARPAEVLKPLLERIMDLGREMCEEPSRQGYPSCAEFLRSGSAPANATSGSVPADAPPAAGRLQGLPLGEAATERRAWERLLTSKIQAFGRELCDDPSRRDYLACAQFRDAPVEGSGAAADSASPAGGGAPESRGEWSSMTDWAQGVAALQEQLESRMHSLRSWKRKHQDARGRQAVAALGSEGGKASLKELSAVAAWARDLQGLREHPSTHQAGAAPMRSAEVLKPLRERIADLGREMCEEPFRRGYPACAQFLAGGNAAPPGGKAAAARSGEANAAPQAPERLHGKGHGALAWEEQLSSKIRAFGRELCSDPRRRGYLACVQFRDAAPGSSGTAVRSAGPEGERSTSSLAPRTALRGAEVESYLSRLSWTDVTAWKGAPQPRVSVARGELKHVHWQGKLPKVACITVIPSGREARARMMYFINNFLLQDYEGPRQLVLVYALEDREAAQLVKAHADGAFVKGVPLVREETVDSLPSAAAFRYGRWRADEPDVVARWDFGAWHHPQRLKMQVRALALARRPACVLAGWAIAPGPEGSGAPTGAWAAGSLVGESRWMREHWFPLLGTAAPAGAGPPAVGEDALGEAEARFAVQVDMPELLVPSSAPQEAPARRSEAGIVRA